MKNTIKLIENNHVLATTSFTVMDIGNVVWKDMLDNEITQENGHSSNAFYGENLKLCAETESIADGTELEVEINAKNEDGTIIEIKNEDDTPIIISAKVSANQVIFEPFYVNPKWFDKEAPITYTCGIKIKGEEDYLAENVPDEAEKQLKPIGFGKPDLFKIDKAKGYLLEKQADGTKIAYTSGERVLP